MRAAGRNELQAGVITRTIFMSPMFDPASFSLKGLPWGRIFLTAAEIFFLGNEFFCFRRLVFMAQVRKGIDKAVPFHCKAVLLRYRRNQTCRSAGLGPTAPLRPSRCCRSRV